MARIQPDDVAPHFKTDEADIVTVALLSVPSIRTFDAVDPIADSVEPIPMMDTADVPPER